MLKTYIIPAILLLNVTGLDAKEIKNIMSIPDLKTMRAMNGIDPGKYDRFWEKWPLVTARFRPDKGEQRFIYANPVAYETMKEGLLTFPDGSVFGKVAFISKEDPQFPNSFEPANYSRLQLMVKDSKKFNDTDGWSYWLHTDSAKTLPSEDRSNMMACHACHALVKEKDYIFSAPTFLAERSEWYGKIGDRFRAKFQTRAYSQLTEFEKNVVELLPEKPEKIKTLRMRLFTGSLYESIGPLARFVQNNPPYMLVDPAAKRFIIAVSLKPADGCKERSLIYADRRKIKGAGEKIRAARYLGKGIVCDGANEWVEKSELPESLKD